MNAFRFLRAVAFICSFSLLLPFAVSCSNETATESNAPSHESETSAEQQKKPTVTVGERDFELVGIDQGVSSEGVYAFTPDYESNVTPKNENDFFDAVVIDNSVIAVYPKGKNAIIPGDGFVLRFYMSEADVSVGNAVKTDAYDIGATPQKYVRFGDKVIEIGHENELRADEDTGWLYDSRWYSASTKSNVWCTEIAIKDGKIVDINR